MAKVVQFNPGFLIVILQLSCIHQSLCAVKPQNQQVESRILPSTLSIPEIREKQYILQTTTKKNWYAASESCNKHGLQLATIMNAIEMQLVDNLINNFGLKENFWIGGTDLSLEGTFVWQPTGKPFEFAKWEAPQPDNYRGNEHCVNLWPDTNGFSFNDYVCTNKLYYICETRNSGCMLNQNRFIPTFEPKNDYLDRGVIN